VMKEGEVGGRGRKVMKEGEEAGKGAREEGG
jgi:hypothetical protein